MVFKGKSKVSEFWRTSGLSFSDFFSPGDLQRVLTHYVSIYSVIFINT